MKTNAEGLIYQRAPVADGPVGLTAPPHREEVEQLLEKLQQKVGNNYLVVETIQRISKDGWNRKFDEKKRDLEQRSKQDVHWKELDTDKKSMRDKLLGVDKVLDLEVYAGVDSQQTLKGIADTGMAATKCGNGWFGKGPYVTTHAWYAARYGLACYKDGGILDPHAADAVDKRGRLLVCRAVMSNVYPIMRSCKRDHQIADFVTAARKGKPQSKWFGESKGEDSAKAIALQEGFDAHFVRVMKMGMDDYANFQACPDDQIFCDDGIADEIVVLEEAQLLPQYYVHFSMGSTDPRNQEFYWESEDSLCKFEAYTSSGSTSTQNTTTSTIKMMDSPRQVDVLLVFAVKKHINYMLEKYNWIDSKLFKVKHEVITDFDDLSFKVRDYQPSIVYIEGSSSEGAEGLPWERLRPDLHLIGELADLSLMLEGPLGENQPWRGCIFNFGTAEQEIVEKELSKHEGKIDLLTWAKHPSEKEMERLFRNFFHLTLPEEMKKVKSTDSENKTQLAFKPACASVKQRLGPSAMLAVAPVNNSGSVAKPLHESQSKRVQLIYKSAKKMKGLYKFAKKQVTSKKEFACSEIVTEAHLETSPNIVDEFADKIDNDAKGQLEESLKQEFPEGTISHGPDLSGIGSLYFLMDINAFEWLCDRVNNSSKPLYLALPMALGGGEVRIQKVLPGRTCWFVGEVQTNRVNALCNSLVDELAQAKDQMTLKEMRRSRACQPQTLENAQLRSCSESRRFSERPVKTVARKCDHHSALREGDAIRVFSRSLAAWMDGEVVEFVGDNFVRVGYEGDGYWTEKTLYLHSEHLDIPSAITSSSDEDTDPGMQKFVDIPVTFINGDKIKVRGIPLNSSVLDFRLHLAQIRPVKVQDTMGIEESVLRKALDKTKEVFLKSGKLENFPTSLYDAALHETESVLQEFAVGSYKVLYQDGILSDEEAILFKMSAGMQAVAGKGSVDLLRVGIALERLFDFHECIGYSVTQDTDLLLFIDIEKETGCYR